MEGGMGKMVGGMERLNKGEKERGSEGRTRVCTDGLV